LQWEASSWKKHFGVPLKKDSFSLFEKKRLAKKSRWLQPFCLRKKPGEKIAFGNSLFLSEKAWGKNCLWLQLFQKKLNLSNARMGALKPKVLIAPAKKPLASVLGSRKHEERNWRS
jgi:hypothetical protein